MGSTSLSDNVTTIQSISLLASIRAQAVISSYATTLQSDQSDYTTVQQRLYDVLREWPLGWAVKVTPNQLYLPGSIILHLSKLQAALSKALRSIVERWFTDVNARFPERLVLEEHEELLLRWMDGVGSKLVPRFSECSGLSRPDFLFERVVDARGEVTQNVRVCEINSRLPYNGICAVPYTNEALNFFKPELVNLKTTLDGETLWSTILRLLDVQRPLHGVLDMFADSDIHLFADYFCKSTGQPFRLLKPRDLRLRPDTKSETGYSLWCVAPAGSTDPKISSKQDGETWEPVYQLTANLAQEEYKLFSPEMLREIARCIRINDLRTVFLLNDQRLLGVLCDELDNLVSVQRALTEEEADLIRNGVVPSYLPSSPTWQSVMDECERDPHVKDNYVLKATRSGSGKGHVFGLDSTNARWLEAMAQAKRCNSDPALSSFLLQKLIKQTELGFVPDSSGQVEKFQVAGSWFNVNLSFQGTGGYRIGRDRCISLSRGYSMVSLTELHAEVKNLDD